MASLNDVVSVLSDIANQQHDQLTGIKELNSTLRVVEAGIAELQSAINALDSSGGNSGGTASISGGSAGQESQGGGKSGAGGLLAGAAGTFGKFAAAVGASQVARVGVAGLEAFAQSGGNVSSGIGGTLRGSQRLLSSVPILGQAIGARDATSVIDRTEASLQPLVDLAARSGGEIDKRSLERLVRITGARESRVQGARKELSSTVNSLAGELGGGQVPEDLRNTITQAVEFGIKLSTASERLGAFSELLSKVSTQARKL